MKIGSSYCGVWVTKGKITVNVQCTTEIQGKSILIRVSARFELVRVRVIGSRLYNHVASCYSRTKLSRNQSWVNLLFSVLQDSILDSILDSLFSLLNSLFAQESRIVNWVEKLRFAMDCQLTFERYCMCHSTAERLTDQLTDWLTDCSIDWMNNWILTILLADWLTGLFKGRLIIYVEGAMVPMAIIFLERGARFFPRNFLHSFS